MLPARFSGAVEVTQGCPYCQVIKVSEWDPNISINIAVGRLDKLTKLCHFPKDQRDQHLLGTAAQTDFLAMSESEPAIPWKEMHQNTCPCRKRKAYASHVDIFDLRIF